MTELRIDLQQKMGIPAISRAGAHELLREKDILRVRELFDRKDEIPG
jgi:hypothetical protein